jgi:5-amino-6-(5-phosphoribosylamino)uracil reductase
VILSAAVSLDGYLDDAGPVRLLLSNEADFERVDELRASVDAILVGAGTIRADDPRLLVRSPHLRARRLASGKPGSPLKITLTSSGSLDPGSRFFTSGDGTPLVFVASPGHVAAQATLGSVATVIEAGAPIDLPFVLRDLAGRGVERLMVEGGGTVHTQFLAAGLVDELQLAVAPLLLGSAGGPRFVNPAVFSLNLELASVRRLDDVVVLRYLMGNHG